MRVVSLVPSWTETLLQAGVDVVGRTRFCIHPREKVAEIPRVGGTKDWNLQRIRELKPDLLILDREENPKFMAEQAEFPYLATHIESVNSMPEALREMNLRLGGLATLSNFQTRWEQVLAWKGLAPWASGQEIPGVIEWGRRPERPVQRVIYVIWRDPWMAVSRQTFIGSVLAKCGILLPEFASRYPVIDLADFPTEDTLLLLSSEPYPFLRKRGELEHLVHHAHAFVDGESFSWFGVRTLAFLESLMLR